MHRRFFLALAPLIAVPVGRTAWAHHGWSSFDQTRPLYLEGKALKVSWRNPHAELELELPAGGFKLPGYFFGIGRSGGFRSSSRSRFTFIPVVRQLYFEALPTRLNNATEKGKSRRAAYSTFFNSQLRAACVAEEFDVPAG